MFPSVFRNLLLRDWAGIQVFNYQSVFLLVICPVLFGLHIHLSRSTGVTGSWLWHAVTHCQCQADLGAVLNTGVMVPEKAQTDQVGMDWWLHKGIPVFTAGTGTCVLHISWVNATGSLKYSVNSFRDDKRGTCSPSFPSKFITSRSQYSSMI